MASSSKASGSKDTPSKASSKESDGLRYVQYSSDKESLYLPSIRQLISKDLSEPYSIYVYRYFLYQWGELCYMVRPLLSHFLHPAFLFACRCIYTSLPTYRSSGSRRQRYPRRRGSLQARTSQGRAIEGVHRHACRARGVPGQRDSDGAGEDDDQRYD